MRSDGRHVVPFTTYVVKVVSRCNLNCSYCYMYNLQDQTYRNQPRSMSLETARVMAHRIKSHVQRHGLNRADLILHGGEPLLMGMRAMSQWLEVVRRELEPDVHPSLSMQSNGVLVDEDWINFLADSGVRIGISFDGPQHYHDAFRKYHSGRGSYDDVRRALVLLRSHPRGCEIFSTVLAVPNLNIDPDEFWTHFKQLGVYAADISLPHANHAHPPPGGRWSYRDWLIRLFDLWFYDNESHGFRYFENIIRTVCGYPISTDNIGGRPVGVLVVETNGDYEGTDALKCTVEGMTKLGRNVFHHEIDDIFQIDLVRFLQQADVPVCSTCLNCAAYEGCGGGYLPHRYHSHDDGFLNEGFLNPSVYCDALYGLVEHVYNRLRQHLVVRSGAECFAQ